VEYRAHRLAGSVTGKILMASTGIVLQSDFTGGELAPSLTARVDLSKYQQGCRVLENFYVQAHGGAVKRQGFVLLDTLPDEARLVPFVFNVEQAYCLVFGENWLRVAVKEGFITDDGGNIYQIASPYTLEQAKTLSYTQSADVLFIACHGVPPQKLMRLAHNIWVFTPVNFGAPIATPNTFTVSGFGNNLNTPISYYVTAVNADGKEGNAIKASSTGPASNNWDVDSGVNLSWGAVDGGRMPTGFTRLSMTAGPALSPKFPASPTPTGICRRPCQKVCPSTATPLYREARMGFTRVLPGLTQRPDRSPSPCRCTECTNLRSPERVAGD
jgi:hypothetical protein